MVRRKAGLLFFGLLVGVGLLAAKSKEFWNQPYQRWSRKEIETLLSNSPWARSQSLTKPVTTDSGEGTRLEKDAGIAGQKEVVQILTVRFFSALPVREAYVRMMQLMNNYDEMAAGQQEQFDARFERALKLDVSDRVIVAVDFSSNIPQTNRDAQQFLRNATTDTLSQNVYLITQHLGRVKLKEYFPPSSDGTGAKFIFPRKVNGQEVIQPGDQQATFELYFPPVNDTYRLQFNVEHMSYDGAISY